MNEHNPFPTNPEISLIEGRYLRVRPHERGWLALDLAAGEVVLLEQPPGRVWQLDVPDGATGPEARWVERSTPDGPGTAGTELASLLGLLGGSSALPGPHPAAPGPASVEDAELIRQLQSSDPEERSHAASRLGKKGCPAAFAPLCTVLDDPDPDVRRYAADALGRLGNKDAVTVLAGKLQDPDRWVAQWAAAALHRLGESPFRHGFVGSYTIQTESGEEQIVDRGSSG